MLKCPYCHEVLPQRVNRCPHCEQFFLDEIIDSPLPNVNSKPCLFCGKTIVREARYCRHCRKWLDEVDQTINDIDWDA